MSEKDKVLSRLGFLKAASMVLMAGVGGLVIFVIANLHNFDKTQWYLVICSFIFLVITLTGAAVRFYRLSGRLGDMK